MVSKNVLKLRFVLVTCRAFYRFAKLSSRSCVKIVEVTRLMGEYELNNLVID